MPDPIYIPLAPILAALGILLSLSLIVERFLVVFSWLLDRLILLRKSMQWEPLSRLEEKMVLRERTLTEDGILRMGPRKAKSLPESATEIDPLPGDPAVEEENDHFEVSPFKIENEKKVVKEFWLQILGAVVAIIACYVSRFSIWNLITWMPALPEAVPSPEFWEYVITGIIIGSGSKPVHFLMNFLISRKIVITKKELVERLPEGAEGRIISVPKPAVPLLPEKEFQPAGLPLEKILGFRYDGGYRPERLEYTHLRQKPIELIVYHHTAMHSDAPFEAIVAEFERKGWLTGYHCIVFKDGTIRVYGRWDRIGNHTRGYNANSLGIALQGNFEPDPRVPFSNPDGRLGIMYPTSDQLDAAARIVALWAVLYDIPVDFQKNILPHRRLAKKACPGGNFPVANFQQRITGYLENWRKDEQVISAIQQFRSTPMV